jgi:hypothetical protein
MTIGFAACWTNTAREYSASEADERETTERILAAFARGAARGIRTYGLYNCRWSSKWHYLTFWIGPDMTAITQTIADLERAGDFKFSDSEHLVGYLQSSTGFLTPGAWEEIPASSDDEALMGLLLTWRARHGAAQMVPAGVEMLLAPLVSLSGLRMLGEFDARLSSRWDRFTFWIAPRVETLESGLAALEREGLFAGAGAQSVTGNHERYYRFGSHLQLSAPLADGEGQGR